MIGVTRDVGLGILSLMGGTILMTVGVFIFNDWRKAGSRITKIFSSPIRIWSLDTARKILAGVFVFVGLSLFVQGWVML